MLSKKGLWLGLMLILLLPFATAQADGIQNFVLSKLDGKGTVDNINVAENRIVIDDRLYILSGNVTVFDLNRRNNVSVSDIKAGDSIGFKSKPLPKPTAPYDQVIIKLWILPSGGK